MFTPEDRNRIRAELLRAFDAAVHGLLGEIQCVDKS
jgi:hypothetical protein